MTTSYGGASTSKWQPINAAPRDGTPMLLCYWDRPDHDNLPVTSGFWSRLEEKWYSDITSHIITPTHWMPLPSPPTISTITRADRK